MSTKKEEKYVYKAVPVGDGSLYGVSKFTEEGELVETFAQTWPTEADAEKYARTIASKSDTVEVPNIKNINPDANVNVTLVKPAEAPEVVPNPEGTAENAGMATTEKPVDQKAVEPTEAEQKAIDAAKAKKEKADKEAAKDAKYIFIPTVRRFLMVGGKDGMQEDIDTINKYWRDMLLFKYNARVSAVLSVVDDSTVKVTVKVRKDKRNRTILEFDLKASDFFDEKHTFAAFYEIFDDVGTKVDEYIINQYCK